MVVAEHRLQRGRRLHHGLRVDICRQARLFGHRVHQLLLRRCGRQARANCAALGRCVPCPRQARLTSTGVSLKQAPSARSARRSAETRAEIVCPVRLVVEPRALLAGHHPRRHLIGHLERQDDLAAIVPHPHLGRHASRLRCAASSGFIMQRRRAARAGEAAEGRGDALVGSRRNQHQRMRRLPLAPARQQGRGAPAPGQSLGFELDLARRRRRKDVVEQHQRLAVAVPSSAAPSWSRSGSAGCRPAGDRPYRPHRPSARHRWP